MKTLTATDLKTRTGEFFDALLADGEVTITRNGKSFPLKLHRSDPREEITPLEALAQKGGQFADRDLPLRARSARSRKVDFR